MWRDTAAMPVYGRLEGDVRTDVLVIGGGMAGICARIFSLVGPGVDCVLAEADRLCAGTTGNTTAKITSQHGLVYDGLLRRFGAEKAGMYLHANEAALARATRHVPGDRLRVRGGRASADSLDDRESWKELAALEKLGFHAGFTDKLPLPFPVAGAVRFERQGQFTCCALPRPRPEGCGPTSTRPCAGWRGRAPLPTAGRSARRRSS